MPPYNPMMERTWLVQRLEKPWSKKLADGKIVDNPFAFGGGYKNGGLSDEAMTLIRDIFSFDYMGAAEFEFGEVPKALSKIAEAAKKLTAFVLAIPSKDIAPLWGTPKQSVRAVRQTTCTTCGATPGKECVTKSGNKTPEPHSNRLVSLARLDANLGIEGVKWVYVLCPDWCANEVAERIRGFAKDGYRSDLKETTQLNRALQKERDDYPTRVCGWLELDNGFMFFTDKEMWEKTCKLFGVETPDGD